MDWLQSNLLIHIISWLPWLNVINDVFLLQFIILYILYLIYFSVNIYFILFYLFIEFFFFGIFLAIYNLELFTAFLWLTECVIVFVSILFLFYLNVYGNVFKTNLLIYSFKYFGLYIGFFLLMVNLTTPYSNELLNYYNLNTFNFWDDYYESLYNNKLNDLFGIYISYYLINSFEFVLIGFLLLAVSLVCVNLNKFNKNFKLNNYYDLFTLFDFYNDFVKFFFMRKQNLVDQEIKPAATKIFNKKTSKEKVQ